MQIVFLHVPKELISTYIFFLDSICSTGIKGVAKSTSSILYVSRKLMFKAFVLHVQKDFLFNTHLLSTCSKGIDFESTSSIYL